MMNNGSKHTKWCSWLFGGATLIATAIGIGCWVGRTTDAMVTLGFSQIAQAQNKPLHILPNGYQFPEDPLDSYQDTMALLKHYAYVNINSKEMKQYITYEAIRGMLSVLNDPYSDFLDSDNWSQLQATTEGNFEGIGAVMEQEGDAIRVVRTIEGSPAENAGLQSGDRVLSINRHSLEQIPLQDTVKFMKGSLGSKVLLEVKRGNRTLHFEMRRALVEPPVVYYWMEDEKEKIGRIVLAEFNEKSLTQLRDAYQGLEKAGMRGLVFDLRCNPGGLLETAEDVASLFISSEQAQSNSGVVVYIYEGHRREKAVRLHTPAFPIRQLPMVTLVNETTASASEIVAGALRDYQVSTLMGERTYGKGRVQTLFPLEDGSALRLTTAYYYPPRHDDINYRHDANGNKIAGTGGIVPDVVVKQSNLWKQENFKDKVNDVQLHAAIRMLQTQLKEQTIAGAKRTLPGIR